MAQINGISLKKVTTFKDHEGCQIAQGDVYYKGKKLGFWTQDAWGGGDMYDFNTSVLDAEVEKYKASDLVDEKYREYTDLDCLLCDLLKLIDDEKSYKKGVKKGYNAYVLVDQGYRTSGYYTNGTKPEIEKTKYYKQFVKEVKKNDTDKVIIYTSLDDFKIAV